MGYGSAGFQLNASEMIKASRGMVEVMRGTRDTTIALSHELSQQEGMAGDDDAGQAFAKMYEPAAKITVDQMGFSAYVLGQTSAGLMQTAREYMATDSQIAKILNKQEDLSQGLANPNDDCQESFLSLGQELPEVIGDTAWYHQYRPGGGERFRGSPDKLRGLLQIWVTSVVTRPGRPV